MRRCGRAHGGDHSRETETVKGGNEGREERHLHDGAEQWVIIDWCFFLLLHLSKSGGHGTFCLFQYKTKGRNCVFSILKGVRYVGASFEHRHEREIRNSNNLISPIVAQLYL